MIKLILISCFSVFLFLLSCDTNEPLPEGALGLTLEDVSCTEAWITLTAGNLPSTSFIKITKNGNLLETIDVNSTKTLLSYDSLKPNTTYEFQAFSSLRGEDVIGNKLQVTTLDTTSHNFSWQTFEFGQHSSSVLYDVAIINENDIWAVGEIYMNDSLGNPDPSCYNAVHWDGQSWELKKTGGFGGYPRRTVFGFSENEVWFDGVIKWDGVNYTVHKNGFPLEPNGDGWQINKMWGSSSNDLYAVGKNGNIAHYNGSSWTKIESGTTTNINDAWGVFENGISTVFCPVSSIFNPPQDKKILKIINFQLDSVNWRKDRILYSCWTSSNNFLFVCGGGVFINKFGTWEQITLPAITTNSIRGNDINDVFAVGSLGTIFHFNGISWQVISSYTQKENYRVAIKNNVVAICGYYNGKGFVEIGRRN